MTANDRGHINNLNENEKKSLKLCWINLINEIIIKHNYSTIDEMIDSEIGEELFNAIAHDNPDVLLLRWLRARKWNVDHTVENLSNTIKWRNEINLRKIIFEGENESIQQELRTGKSFIIGKDRQGRPVTYIQVSKHIKGQYSDESIQMFTIFHIEICRKLLDDEVETSTIIIDFKGFSMRNIDFQLIKFMIDLLENHYPECLGVALIINASLLFYSCWNIIKNLLDPIVQSKILILKDLGELVNFVDPSILSKHLNGTREDLQYIPPSEKDKMISFDLHQDELGYEIARKIHKDVVKKYIEITLEWANDEKNNQQLLVERIKTIKQLRKAFEQLIPHISTKTFYHRQGIVNEPIFDNSHKKLIQRREEKIVMF